MDTQNTTIEPCAEQGVSLRGGLLPAVNWQPAKIFKIVEISTSYDNPTFKETRSPLTNTAYFSTIYNLYLFCPREHWSEPRANQAAWEICTAVGWPERFESEEQLLRYVNAAREFARSRHYAIVR